MSAPSTANVSSALNVNKVHGNLNYVKVSQRAQTVA